MWGLKCTATSSLITLGAYLSTSIVVPNQGMSPTEQPVLYHRYPKGNKLGQASGNWNARST